MEQSLELLQASVSLVCSFVASVSSANKCAVVEVRLKSLRNLILNLILNQKKRSLKKSLKKLSWNMLPIMVVEWLCHMVSHINNQV